jgi:hypothetical protein
MRCLQTSTFGAVRVTTAAGTVNLGRGLAGGTVNLMECGRNDARDKAGDTDGYAVAATPVTSAQV